MQTPNLYRVILPVPDIERSATFYGAVFETPGQRVSPARHYFQCGGAILACYDPAADGDVQQEGWRFHPFQYLYFSVGNLDLMFKRFRKAGGTVDMDIETMPWGERMFYGRDPFGSRISCVDEATVFKG